MIFTPSKEAPRLVGSADERRRWEKFRLFYDPAELSLSGDAPVLGYGLENLCGGVYGEFVQWGAGEASLNGSFPAREITAVVLGRPSFETLGGAFYLDGREVLNLGKKAWAADRKEVTAGGSSARLVFNRGGARVERRLAPGADAPDAADQNVWVMLAAPFRADRFEFVLSGGGPVSLGKLYVGGSAEWAPGERCSYALESGGAGGLTDAGTVYGSKRPSRRTFSYSWSIIDDAHRREMEKYIDAVQDCAAHYIMPFEEDGDFLPPMFVRLASPEAKNERWAGGWFWNSPCLTWEVLR